MDPVNRRVTYKLYPTAAQQRELWQCHKLHCDLYNAARQERIDAYRLARKTISFQQADVVGLAIELKQASSPSYAARLGNLARPNQHRGINALSPIFGAHDPVVVKCIYAVI